MGRKTAHWDRTKMVIRPRKTTAQNDQKSAKMTTKTTRSQFNNRYFRASNRYLGLRGTTGHHLKPTQNDSEVVEETIRKNIPLDALSGNRGPKIQDHPSTSQQIVKTRKTDMELKIFRSCPASWEGKRCNQIRKWRSESGDWAIFVWKSRKKSTKNAQKKGQKFPTAASRPFPSSYR